jgi:hypothetical protein|tara:strand:+ start:2044 stop:2460 length:417 start_codon:yes stop_codon:yes gene_type:complete
MKNLPDFMKPEPITDVILRVTDSRDFDGFIAHFKKISDFMLTIDKFEGEVKPSYFVKLMEQYRVPLGNPTINLKKWNGYNRTDIIRITNNFVLAVSTIMIALHKTYDKSKQNQANKIIEYAKAYNIELGLILTANSEH